LGSNLSYSDISLNAGKDLFKMKSNTYHPSSSFGNTFLIVLISIFYSCNTEQASLEKVEKWAVFEIELNGPEEGSPFFDVELSATFTCEDERINVLGFYDGNGIYKIRFSPNKTGKWKFETRSNTDILADNTGSFECIPPTGKNHGPLQKVNTFYLQYADSTPFYSVGTTAYQWTSVKQSIQEKTVQTLATSPFNKIRMCVFPKKYKYGNDTEPWQYPFKRENGENDFKQPNYDFFQNFDKRIQQLLELGIQADVILFHPYDKEWNYFKMGHEMNDRYVRYMIARISAYRNVWWSLANEWDIPEIKEAIDWEGIGTLLQNEDPHHRLIGIHNWYNSEDHYYDHTRPWLTHASVQTSQFYNIPRWREMYQKPILFDEMRYEGDVPSGWGNLTGEEMTSYFWMTGLSGAYPTHGETIQNNSDDSTEVRWWAKGGLLIGKSIEPIRYFKEIMEQTPVHDMSPSLIVNGDSSELNNNVYTLSKKGHYLTYVADSAQNIHLELEGESDLQLEVIDTWNQKVIEKKMIKPEKFEYVTTSPFTMLRIFQVENP